MVDPEALLLTSLGLSASERRFSDLVSWWVRTGTSLTSVQRMKAISGRYPPAFGSEPFAHFAAMASSSGDRRWASHARAEFDDVRREPKGGAELRLIRSSALWLRLRAGLGVGAKTDALAYLIGLRGAPAGVAAIASALGYSTVAIRHAVSGMAIAGLVRESDERPALYSTPMKPWAILFETRRDANDREADPPAWCYWAEILAYLAHVIEWSRQENSPGDRTPRVAASRARDLLQAARPGFVANDVPVPDPRSFQGLEVLDCLRQTTQALGSWIGDHL